MNLFICFFFSQFLSWERCVENMWFVQIHLIYRACSKHEQHYTPTVHTQYISGKSAIALCLQGTNLHLQRIMINHTLSWLMYKAALNLSSLLAPEPFHYLPSDKEPSLIGYSSGCVVLFMFAACSVDEMNLHESHIFYTSLSTEELTEEETDEEVHITALPLSQWPVLLVCRTSSSLACTGNTVLLTNTDIHQTGFLNRLSDENGPMEFTMVCDGVIPRACLDPMDG